MSLANLYGAVVSRPASVKIRTVTKIKNRTQSKKEKYKQSDAEKKVKKAMDDVMKKEGKSTYAASFRYRHHWWVNLRSGSIRRMVYAQIL